MPYLPRVAAIRRKLYRLIVIAESGDDNFTTMRLYDLDCRLANRLRGIARPTR